MSVVLACHVLSVRPSNRIQIRNVPAAVSKDDIDQLVAHYGTVKKSNLGMHTSFIYDCTLLPRLDSPQTNCCMTD